MWDDQDRAEGRPKSYLIELLVIKAYEDCMQSSQQMYEQNLITNISYCVQCIGAHLQELWELLHYHPACQIAP